MKTFLCKTPVNSIDLSCRENVETPASKFTPGPWAITESVFSSSATKEYHIGTPSITAAVVYVDLLGPNAENMKANAHLVAAAPELLDALCAALPFVEDALDSDDFKPGYVKSRAAMIRKAIQRAEGKQ